MEPKVNPIIENDEDGFRWYQIDGKKYISTTEVLDCVQPKKLQNWFKKTSPGQIEKRSTESAKVGSDIHHLIRSNLEGSELPILEDYRGPYAQWLELRNKHRISAVKTEEVVYSKLLGVAGTADIIGLYEDLPAIMDAKTGFYGVKAGFQMASYKLCYEEMTGDSGYHLVGLHVPRDGREAKAFKIEHREWCILTFLSCLQVWKALNFYKLQKMEWPWLFSTSVLPNLPQPNAISATMEPISGAPNSGQGTEKDDSAISAENVRRNLTK